MATSKVVEAMAAIDHNGKWIICGFDDLETVAHLHETGMTKDLEEPMAFFRVRAMLFLPDALEIATVAGATIAVSE